jgi:DNA-binding transcriptional ArsR family regulator
MGMTEIFRALSDPTRREIIRMLRERAMTAGEIAEHFELAKPTLSGHFNVLRGAGLIVSEKHAQKVVYSLNISALEDVLNAVMEMLDVGGGWKKQRRSRNP